MASKKASTLDGSLVKGKNIKVKVSRPPSKSDTRPPVPLFPKNEAKAEVEQDSKVSEPEKPKVYEKSKKPLLPRAMKLVINKPSTTKNKESTVFSSNEEFRKKLLGK